MPLVDAADLLARIEAMLTEHGKVDLVEGSVLLNDLLDAREVAARLVADLEVSEGVA